MTVDPTPDRLEIQSVGVIGAGAWGTALASVAVRAGRETKLWAHEPEVASQIADSGENRIFLPGVPLDPALIPTADLGTLSDCDALLLVVPAQFLRGVASRLAAAMTPRPVVLCAKGIEQGSGSFMTDVAVQTLPGWPIAVLSGPSFAADVARGLPTAVTLASSDANLAEQLAAALGSKSFRPYTSGDPLGAEIGGAVKNVLAIATGIVVGRKLGESAKAATIARGFAELTRFGRARGAQEHTMAGLSGLGDLILTCTSQQSRNMSLGMALGEGRALTEILGGRRAVTEGVATAPALAALAGGLGIAMPICCAVDDVLAGRKTVEAAVDGLLGRPLGPETL